MPLSLSFLGGAGTVTGSKYAVEHGNNKILVDCGFFQGFKALRLKNWAPFPIVPRSIKTVMLTHAHLDHSGYLPLLVKLGFSGPIHCSKATADLCRILSPNSGYLQEKDAEYANRHGFSKHKPALPLYDGQDARKALEQLTPMPFDQDEGLSDGAAVRLRRAGHILGAASIELRWAGITVVFSGDLGRYGDATMVDPVAIEKADYLFVESTYGDRRHDKRDPGEALAEIVGDTIGRGGTVIIPSFAVGRAQSLMFYLEQLKAHGRLSNVPIFLDSPMAEDASDIFCRDSGNQSRRGRVPAGLRGRPLRPQRGGVEGSDRQSHAQGDHLGERNGNGGTRHASSQTLRPRPQEHDPLRWFQAGGTRGAAMLAGADSVKNSRPVCAGACGSPESSKCCPPMPMRMKSCAGCTASRRRRA